MTNFFRATLPYISFTLLLIVSNGYLFAQVDFDPQAQPFGFIAPVALSKPSITRGDTILYQPTFDFSSYDGNLNAFTIGATGAINTKTPLWRAGDQLNVLAADDPRFWDTGRRIISVNNNQEAVPFRFKRLSLGQQALVVSEDIVNYIRGQRSLNVDDPTGPDCRRHDDDSDDDNDHEGAGSSHHATHRSSSKSSSSSDNDDRGGHHDDDHDDDGCCQCATTDVPMRSLLGAIIHARPAYVGQPREGYPFDNYGRDFAQPLAQRTSLVYVGANDGMLHGFNADTGREVFAYVPSMVHGNLPKYALLNSPGTKREIDCDDDGVCAGNTAKRHTRSTTHSSDHAHGGGHHDEDDDSGTPSPPTPTAAPLNHVYFVDGQLTTGDVLINGVWHTVLIGGLGAGGQGFFALDVSDPSTEISDEQSVTDLFLWEFSDGNDSDLGFTYSRPSIVRLNDSNKTWAAIFGNGYGNTYDDVNRGNGQAALYIINIATGEIIKKITVGDADLTEANGLSSPTVMDTDGNYTADFVYAGDIKGNLWKFDLNSPNPDEWRVTFDTKPLFTAKTADGTPQAITTAPAVAVHPIAGFLVYIGTGRLLNHADSSDSTIQSVYGLWDNDTPIFDRSQLQTKTLSAASVDDQRTVSGAKISWQDHVGWQLNLPAGERVLTDPLLRAKRLQFTTTNPMSGNNWLTEVDFITGAVPRGAIFNDNEIPADVVSIEQGPGLVSRPTFAAISASQDAFFVNRTMGVEASCSERKEKDIDRDDDDDDLRENHHGKRDARDADMDHDSRNDDADEEENDDDDDSHDYDECDAGKNFYRDDDKDDDGDSDDDDDGHAGENPSEPTLPTIETATLINLDQQSGDNRIGRSLWREILR